MAVDAFGIEKEFLRDLLRDVAEGHAQLPDFQRGWVWPQQNISSLLASISLGYPAGTVMMLRTGGDVRFKQRPVEGATPPAAAQPERLILDGQQRLTSLFQALWRDLPVRTHNARKQPVEGRFYIDIRAALDDGADREDAIRFLPADRIVRNFRHEPIEDYSTPEREYAAHLFPLFRIFAPDDWLMGFLEQWEYDKEKTKLSNVFRNQIVRHFDLYQMPVIEVGKHTPRQAVCQVFEKVNTGGVTLTVFELLTATFAADEFDLRKHWQENCKAAWAGPKYRVVHEVSNTDFLQAVALLATRERREAAAAQAVEEDRLPRTGCKRADMLGLTLHEYQRLAPTVVNGIKDAARFLYRQYLFEPKYLPYGTQLIPLAAILAVLGAGAENASAQQKLARWFWCGVFGELYGGTTETRFSFDLPEVVAWIRDSGPEPRTVAEAQFSSGRLLTLRTRGSAAYKGVYALLLAHGAQDWLSGEATTVTGYFDNAIDIHHIFPKAWCESQDPKIPPQIYNSVINKTPLTAHTNRVIGGRAPSEYLPKLVAKAGTDYDTVAKHIATHFAQPDLLECDDFETFMAERRRALLGRIAEVTGIAIPEMESVAGAEDEIDEVEQDDTNDL